LGLKKRRGDGPDVPYFLILVGVAFHANSSTASGEVLDGIIVVEVGSPCSSATYSPAGGFPYREGVPQDRELVGGVVLVSALVRTSMGKYEVVEVCG